MILRAVRPEGFSPPVMRVATERIAFGVGCQARLRSCAAKPLGGKELQPLREDGGRDFPGEKQGVPLRFPFPS